MIICPIPGEGEVITDVPGTIQHHCRGVGPDRCDVHRVRPGPVIITYQIRGGTKEEFMLMISKVYAN